MIPSGSFPGAMIRGTTLLYHLPWKYKTPLPAPTGKGASRCTTLHLYSVQSVCQGMDTVPFEDFFWTCCLLLVVWHKYQQLTPVNQQPRNIKAPVRILGQGRVVFAVPPCIILSWFIRNGDCRLLYLKKPSFNPELTREFRLTLHTDSHHPSALWNDNHNTFSCSSPVYWVELIIHGRRPSVKWNFALCGFSMNCIYSYEIYAILQRGI